MEGFLNKQCAPFCKELWNLMLSAQQSTAGVPKELLEAKKLELQQEQVRLHLSAIRGIETTLTMP